MGLEGKEGKNYKMNKICEEHEQKFKFWAHLEVHCVYVYALHMKYATAC